MTRERVLTLVLPPKGDGAHAAFGGVVIEFQDAVVEVGPQAFHTGQGENGGEKLGHGSGGMELLRAA